jgi:hexosaminidase
VIAFAAAFPQDSMPIIPKPKEVTFSSVKFPLRDSSISIKTSIKDSSKAKLLIDELQNEFFTDKGFNINRNKKSKQIIRIGLPERDTNFKQLCIKNKIWPQEKIGNQGYVLLVKENIILIAAKTYTGIFYGVQSLKQLIRSNRNGYLEGVKINDWPSLNYRGILDDISRGPVPTVSFMKKEIRRLSELKINFLQYYTENVVATKSHPDFAPPDGSISISEWKELAEYAREYQIMLIGNFQSFAHFEKILSYPKYAPLGERGDVLSPVYPGSIKLLADIYKEMVPAFNAPFFNIDADEVSDLGKGASKKLVDSLGYARVYSDQIIKIHNVLKKLGVKTMMWGDIALEHPEILKMLPKDIIMMTWGYDPQDSYDNMILPFLNAGYKVTVSPAVLNSDKIFPDFTVSLPDINGIVHDGVKNKVLGMVNTIWDEGNFAFLTNDWYGIAYSAEQSWTPTDESVTDFNEKFNSSIYGEKNNAITNTITTLDSLTYLASTNGMSDKIMWTKLIPDKGENIKASSEDWDKVLKICDSAEANLKNAKAIHYSGDVDYLQLIINLYRYAARSRFSLLASASSYKEASKLEMHDRSNARKKLQNALSSIDSLHEELLNIYNQYENLWLREDQTNALNNTLDKFSSQISSLKDIEDKILSAIQQLDEHKFIPPPDEVRLSIQAATGQYLKDWMMVNPIPNPEGNEKNNIDYLQSMGGELNAIPKVGQEFDYEGKTYRWRRTSSDYFDLVDLNDVFSGDNDHVVTYAFANIQTYKEQNLTADLSTTDRIDIILDGKKVYSTGEVNSKSLMEFKFDLSLKEGKNNIMMEIFHTDGDWKFSLTFQNEKITNSKNRYKIME